MEARVSERSGLEELDRAECLRLLKSAPIGRLGVVIAGRPLIFPVNFTLDGTSIVFRTATGSKLYGARNGPVVFECDGIDLVYHTGWSVLVHAAAEEVRDPFEIARLERLPLAPWSDAPKPCWLRLRANFITGRRIAPHHGVEDRDPRERDHGEMELPCR